MRGIVIAIIVFLLLVLIIGSATLDIVNCTLNSNLSIVGKTTVLEYLFGGSCRGTVLATSVSKPINGIV